MFYGKNSKSKCDILIYLIISLFVEGYIDPIDVENKFNISSLTMYRYISQIINVLYDYEFQYISIYYDRKTKCYKCDCYVELLSKQSVD